MYVFVFILERNTSLISHRFQPDKMQSSSLFDVSSLPWSHHKSLFGAGDDTNVSKFGEFCICILFRQFH